MKQHNNGFTLLEVLVAVAVLGVAMAAIIKASSEMTATAADLRDRTLANWVAGNVLAELRLEGAWETETRDGDTEMADREWFWEAEIQSTPNPGLRRVDVRVFTAPDGDEEQALAVLTGLLTDPARRQDIPEPPPDVEEE